MDKKVFDLNQYIIKNYNLIMDCKEKKIDFEWDEEAVNAVRKLAIDCCKKIKINKNYREDYVQDFMMKFFCEIIYKWNKELNISIVTYSYKAFSNLYFNRINNRQNEFENETLSLDFNTHANSEIENEWTGLDYTVSDELGPLDRYIEEVKNNFFREKLEEDQILYKYFVEKKTLVEIGKELNLSRTSISNKINKKLEIIKKEYKNKVGKINNKKR